jgi:hypothetical protein
LALIRLIDLLTEEKDIPILRRSSSAKSSTGYWWGIRGSGCARSPRQAARASRLPRRSGWLQNNYAQSISMDQLAAQANMSTSTFHYHFRSLTALSPLQYQKQLRQLTADGRG